ncbi:acyl transferase/acyl hydrolase/lysophospholipase, partial [Delphinella strobiligena]
IIALMLGRLKMSPDQCEKAYCKLSKEIFEPNYRPHDPRRALEKFRAEGKFDAIALEVAIKDVLKTVGLEDAPLMKEDDPTCKTQLCMCSSSGNSEPVHLRTYDNPNEFGDHLSDKFKIWQACRATSAATTFFESFNLKELGLGFVDGGLLYNNPVDKVMSEGKKIWPGESMLLISIGTGNAPGEALAGYIFKVAKYMAKLLTRTEKAAIDFYNANPDMIQKGLYFRFSVPGMASIGLDEYKFLPRITSETLHYLQMPETGAKLRSCIGLLTGKQGMAHDLGTFSRTHYQSRLLGRSPTCGNPPSSRQSEQDTQRAHYGVEEDWRRTGIRGHSLICIWSRT